jgi:hypothetical protein
MSSQITPLKGRTDFWESGRILATETIRVCAAALGNAALHEGGLKSRDVGQKTPKSDRFVTDQAFEFIKGRFFPKFRANLAQVSRSRGYAATREVVMAAFAKSWRRK